MSPRVLLHTLETIHNIQIEPVFKHGFVSSHIEHPHIEILNYIFIFNYYFKFNNRKNTLIGNKQWYADTDCGKIGSTSHL